MYLFASKQENSWKDIGKQLITCSKLPILKNAWTLWAHNLYIKFQLLNVQQFIYMIILFMCMYAHMYVCIYVYEDMQVRVGI